MATWFERSSWSGQGPTEGVEGKKRYAMVIDLRKCIGCHACSVACKAEFDVPLGVWRSWVRYQEKGKYPNVKKHFLPRLCNHCDKPPCVRVCPVQATYKDKDGYVLQRYERCIGCRYCMIACPYNARHILPRKTNAVGYGHVIDKCTFCIHRVEQGVTPACVTTCVGRARVFGDLNDPNSEVAKLVSKHSTVVLKPEAGTRPQVYYIRPDRDIITQEVVYKSNTPKMENDKRELYASRGKIL
jgi:Fe-S-cluster-containing dehydrogenase component